eukprot:3102180-Rhodomonas_salina.1
MQQPGQPWYKTDYSLLTTGIGHFTERMMKTGTKSVSSYAAGLEPQCRKRGTPGLGNRPLL